ncbi:MAG: hypothetical protein JST28_11510 [Acidobacteria bacterium]|nr:hypothetical protein [Acidobacteriota bacterium]
MDTLREDERETLRNFFAAYFHEDWICESESPDGIVAMYICDASPSEVIRLSQAILRLIDCGYDNEELEQTLFRKLGCCYSPSGDGKAAREWLYQVATVLSPKLN